MKKTSLLNNTAMWLGASISIAEIMSGAYIAGIGLKRGLAAIFIGHIIGGLLFYLCGRIGGESGRSSMDCAAFSFGTQGAGVFACINVLQLTAWTAIMLHVSAQALTTITSGLFPTWAWCLLIGLSVMAWVFAGGAEISRINLLASTLLLVLTFVMCQHVLQSGNGIAETVLHFNDLTFGSAIELSLALPLSWIPLVADYSSKAKQPHATNCLGTLTYTVGSIWMYSIGLMAALYCGHSDIIQLLVRTGIIRIPLLIVVLATMTTTFIEACSAGISAQTISKRYSVRFLALVVLILATIASIFVPLEQYDQFLFLIASVFSPMAAIMITDYFLLKKHQTEQILDLGSMLLWAVGFVLYWLLVSISGAVGSTVPLFLILGVIRFVTEKLRGVG
ncbi:MAG: putative hydroxymethylpyrimidine transporter CytX [Eubacteriales bacterium]|nr:putative hydroxymethylpyrimidine transporter CytX [Eubacteriales bacterium]